jgi:DNA mismatch endonuclease, patch repair protein
MADRVSKEQRSKNMRAVRSKGTKLEDKIGKALWKRGVRFRKNVKELFGNPDFAIKKYRVVIFIDSCFWHGCMIHGSIPESNRDFWFNKISRNKRRDAEVSEHYLNQGWFLLRLWEHDIKADFEATIEKIIHFINDAKNKRHG